MWRRAFAVLLFSILVSASAEAQPQYAFRVSFRDKAGAPPLTNPLAFLSQRSLDRRTQQNKAPDTSDQPVSPAYLDSVLSLTQGTLHLTSRWLNYCVILLDDSSKITTLQGRPFINNITYVAYYPNGLHNIQGTDHSDMHTSPKLKTTGSPSYYGSSWGQVNLVHGDCLHDNGWKGQGKLIAVLDDGFHYVDSSPAFDTLFHSGRILETHNFVKDMTDVYTDFNLHGTEVLSTIAAYVPGTYVGAAPFAQFALYVTEDQTGERPIEMDNMVAAFERADSIGADVVSSSLGYNNFDSPFPSIPQSQLDGKTTVAARAANLAVSKGMLLVITAGNEGPGGLLTPGDADSVITVGNVNNNKVPATNSGYGPNAAGVTKPDVCAQGNPGMVMTSSLSVSTAAGTSISTPQVAGFAACLWQGSPGRTNAEIKSALIRSCDLYPNPQMPQLGYGVPDFCKATGFLDVPDIPGAAPLLKVYPSPFATSCSLELSLTSEQYVLVSVTDIAGKQLFSLNFTANAGRNVVALPLPQSLAAGIYLCRVSLPGGSQTLKLVKE